MKRANPYESLRAPGIACQVARNFRSVTIHQRAQWLLAIRFAEIPEGSGRIWYGIQLHTPDSVVETVPGEQNGYFHSIADATLHALGAVMVSGMELPDDLSFAIRTLIGKLLSPTLF